jgi:hypothetical protein
VTINLHAKSDFSKGDKGRVSGHAVWKTDADDMSPLVVTALQDVMSGANGWFERPEHPRK